MPEDYTEFELGMQDPARLQKLYTYFKQQDVTVPENYDEFAGAMMADVKKKPGGDGGSTPTEQVVLGAGALPSGDEESRQQPQVLPLGYQVPGAPLPDAELAADAEAARVYAPGYTGPVPAGTYERPSDKGTTAQGTQYFGTQQPVAPAEAPDVADDGFWASFGKSLYNGLDPKRVGGNLLDYLGDLDEIASPYAGLGLAPGLALGMATNAPVTDNKATDALANSLLAQAQASDLPLSQAAQQDGFSSLAGAGNLLGGGVASIIPVAAATAVGGPLAGAGVGAGLGISGTKEAARAAGIGDKEAAIMATMLAPVQGALEAFGVKDPGVAKLAVRATIKEALAASGGKLTAEALSAAAKKVLPEMARRAAAGAASEGATEFLQGVAEGEAKVVADALRDNPEAPAGQGRYGTTQGEVFKSAAEQGAVGAVLGGGLGPTHGGVEVSPPPTDFATPTIDARRFDLRRPTGQTELSNVQVVALNERTGIATVRGQDAQGKVFQRDVPGGQLYPSKVQPEAQLPPTQTYYVTGDSSATEEGALPEARIIGPGSQPDTVLVEAKTYEGETVQREVAKARLLPNEAGEGFDSSLVSTEPTPSDTPPFDAAPPTPARPAEPEPSPAEAPVPPAGPPAEPDAPVRQVRATEPASKEAIINLRPKDVMTPHKRGFNAEIPGEDGQPAIVAYGDFDENKKAIRIDGVIAGDGQKGKGYGVALYEAILARAQKEGYVLTSDIEVSPDAARLYEALERRGYTVTRNPSAKLESFDGEQKWVSGKGPVFTVNPTKQLAEPKGQVRAAEPDPASVKALTPQQQAGNAALDALDRYNALDARAKKGKEGSAIRAEIAEQARLGGLQAPVKADFSMSVTRDGKRVTRSNEYTATTPAASHVPLAERPEPVRQFAEKVLAATDAGITPLQGLGIKLRGKELSARELQGAVEDIRGGRNTLRAQLVLDTLETAQEQGYVEKSEGTGLATRKYQVPVDEYVGDAPAARKPVELSDTELDQLIADDPKVRQAVDDYIRPDGSVDYQKLADEENALPFLFELSEETSAKLATYARERAQQPAPETRTAEPQAGVEPRSEAQGLTGADEAAPASGAEVAPLTDNVVGQLEPLTAPTEEKKAQIRAEIDAASQRIKERRAERKKAGRVLSSPLGIGEIDAADLADALTIAKGHVQLGVLGIKNIIAKIREAGLSEEDASDAALTPHLREMLTGEPTPELPTNEPDGSATRRSMARLDNDPTTPEALKERVRDTGLDKYEPKSVAETEKAVDDYMQRNSLSDAYAEAISTTDALTGDVRTALRVRVLKALGAQLAAALDKDDAASADAYLEQAEKVTEALAKRGTDAGREINAYKLLVSMTPEAAVYKAQKEVQAQREKASQRLGKKLRTERKAIAKAKAEALDNTLATPAVRQAREKVAGKTKPNTQEKIADIRQQRASLFDELRALSKKKPTVAMVAVVPITPQQVQAAAIHVKIFRTYIQEGVLRVSALVERLRREGGAAVVGTDQQLRQQAAAALGDHEEAIKQGTEGLGRTLDQIARDHLNDVAAIGKTLAQQFVAEAGLSPADAKTYADAIEAEFAKRIAATRQRRLDELAKRAQAAPAKRPKTSDLQATQELFTLSPTDDAAILDHLKRVNDLPELTAQDVAELRKLAQAVQAAPEGFQKDEAVEKLLKRQQEIKGVNWAEIGQAMWYANVLSGYKTHVINFTANVIQTGAELGVNTTHALLTGQGRYAAASSKGLIQGLSRGVREAVSVLTTGRETSREPGKYEVPSILENVRFAGGVANPANYLKFVSRALRAGDVLFSGGLKEMRAYEQAVKFALEDAKSDGTPDQDIWARAAEKLYNTTQRVADARTQAHAEGLTGNDLARRVYEIAEQSRGADIMEDARVYAPRAVFNGEVEGVLGVVSNGIQQITEAVNIRGLKPLKFVVPFTRVITNVANAYLDYTPVGALRAIKGSHFVKEGSTTQREFTREERQKLVIKSVIGGAVMAAAFAASGSDKEDENQLEITGAGTGNPTKDAQLRADGWQPYSLKVSGTWYSYANSPIGAMLAVVGNVNDGRKYRGELLSDDDGALNSLYLGAWRAMQFTKDMTALKSATDFLTALSSRNAVDLTSYGKRLAVGTVKGFVPWSSFLTQTAKDAEQLAGEPRKQGRSFGQMLAQDIPVARNGINNALDALGDPLPVDTDRLFSAPPHRDEPTQRIWSWLNKNGLFVSVPNRNSGGALLLKLHQGKEEPMTDDEYYAFMQKRGELLKSAILNNIQQLEKMEPDKAKRWLEKHSAKINKQAKRAVFGPGAVPIGERATASED